MINFFTFLLILLFLIIIFVVSSKLISNYKISKSIVTHQKKLYQLQKILKKLMPHLPEDQQQKLSMIKLQPSKKSYTIDKHHVHLCINNPESGKYYDNNILTYVLLHEIAHIFCDEEGHTNKFLKIYNKLIDIATKIKIYDPDKPLPKTYCGIKV